MNIHDIPLFIDPPSFEKTAGFKLSDNFKKWDEEIVEHIHEEMPYVTRVPFTIKIKEKDEQLGYAKGSVVLKLKDKTASLPIIIKNRVMSPIDVIMLGEDKAVPLNEDSIMELIQTGTQLGKLVKRKKRGVVAEHQHNRSPGGGMGKYASFAMKKDKESLFNAIEKNASLKAGFITNGTVDCLDRASRVTSVEKIASSDRQKVIGTEVKSLDLGIQELTKTSGAVVVNKNGTHEGIFISDVETLEGTKLAHNLFVGNDGTWAFQEKIAGKSVRADLVTESDFSIGDEITFIKEGAAIEPIQVLSKVEYKDHVKVAARTMHGAKANLYITKCAGIQSVRDGYLIPDTLDVIKLGTKTVMLESDDHIQKIAMARHGGNLSFLRHTSGQYTFDNEKIGGFIGNSSIEAENTLSEFYVNAAEIVKMAENNGKVTVSGIADEAVVNQSEKIACVESCHMEWGERVKIAATLTDPDSVDSILGLGYLNKDNVQEYVEMIPNMDECVNNLARLLIAIRLGLKNGDETSAKMAMKYLQRVIDSLRGL